MGIDPKQFRELVVRPTLQYLGDTRPAMENLLIGTACQESGLKYLHQLGAGPALGVYQVEPATHRDQWDNYLQYHPGVHDFILKLAAIHSTASGIPHENELVGNLPYATAIAWCKYRRAPGALPDAENLYGLANYWKRYYNTAQGAGMVDQWVSNYPT